MSSCVGIVMMLGVSITPGADCINQPSDTDGWPGLQKSQSQVRFTGLAALQAGGFGDDVGATVGHCCTCWLGPQEDCGGLPRHNNLEERLCRPAGRDSSFHNGCIRTILEYCSDRCTILCLASGDCKGQNALETYQGRSTRRSGASCRRQEVQVDVILAPFKSVLEDVHAKRGDDWTSSQL